MTTLHTLYFALALIAYYALHSILAADGVKAALSRIVSQQYYRLVYNLIAVVLFLAIFILYLLVEKTPLWLHVPVLPYVGGLPILLGISWVARAMKRYNLDEFMGLEQLRAGQKPAHNKLIIRGLNGRVRHPLYFGILLIVWGMLLILPNETMLTFSLISTIYIIIGSRLEEEKLVIQFGKNYQKYQREVPMLVPFKLKKVKWF